MATVNANAAGHGTLTAATVEIVNLTSSGRRIQIVNRDAAAFIFVRAGKDAASTPDPVAAGNETYVVPPAQSLFLPWPLSSMGQTVCVKLISAGTPPYSVQVLTDLAVA